MGHDHHHEHSHLDLASINKAFYWGIGINLVYTIIEYVFGYLNDSVALIADATHNLSDVASLIIAMIGMKLASKIATTSRTYGYKKASILASLINAIILIIVVIEILIEGVERLSNPAETSGSIIIIVAAVGVFANTISAFLFFKGKKHDVNVRAAFLHLIVDALVSVGVVISGVMIHFTSWYIIDPIISFVIALIILISTWSLLKESINLILDGVPKGIDFKEIKAIILKNKYVLDVHHIHIWALSSYENALTAHIVLKQEEEINIAIPNVKHELNHELEHFNINHTTFEFETHDYQCDNKLEME